MAGECHDADRDAGLVAGGTAVALSTHDVELAAEVCGRTRCWLDGEVVADGPTPTVVVGSPAVAPQMAPFPVLTVPEVAAALSGAPCPVRPVPCALSGALAGARFGTPAGRGRRMTWPGPAASSGPSPRLRVLALPSGSRFGWSSPRSSGLPAPCGRSC